MAKKLKTQVKGFISKKELSPELLTKETTESLPVDTVEIDDPHHMITVKVGETVNTGNFGSFRVDIGISIPCGKDDVESTYNTAMTWASNKLSEVVSKRKKPSGEKTYLVEKAEAWDSKELAQQPPNQSQDAPSGPTAKKYPFL